MNGGEIMYRQGGSRAEMWRLKSVPPVALQSGTTEPDWKVDWMYKVGIYLRVRKACFVEGMSVREAGPSVRGYTGTRCARCSSTPCPQGIDGNDRLADRSSIHIRV